MTFHQISTSPTTWQPVNLGDQWRHLHNFYCRVTCCILEMIILVGRGRQALCDKLPICVGQYGQPTDNLVLVHPAFGENLILDPQISLALDVIW